MSGDREIEAARGVSARQGILVEMRQFCNFATCCYDRLMNHLKLVSSLGSRIAAARKLNQLTIAQLARRLGVQTKTLTSWQNNSVPPRASRLAMLSGVLGVTPKWLLAGAGKGPMET